jgi:uncharacterized membrane protein
LAFSLLQAGDLMNTLHSASGGLVALLGTTSASAQDGNMMNGGMWGNGWMGRYGGYWVLIVVLAVVVGLVIWVVKQQKK